MTSPQPHSGNLEWVVFLELWYRSLQKILPIFHLLNEDFSSGKQVATSRLTRVSKTTLNPHKRISYNSALFWGKSKFLFVWQGSICISTFRRLLFLLVISIKNNPRLLKYMMLLWPRPSKLLWFVASGSFINTRVSVYLNHAIIKLVLTEGSQILSGHSLWSPHLSACIHCYLTSAPLSIPLLYGVFLGAKSLPLLILCVSN